MFPGLTPRHDPPRLVVVVAHPDDETFGCGSVLLAAAHAGWHTTVVCATRGEAGEPAAGTDLSMRNLGEVREQELCDAADLLGVADVRLLDFVDSGMEGEPADGTLAAAGHAVADAVRREVADLDPDVILTLDAGDGHRDHVSIRDAAVAAGRAQDVPVYLQCLRRSLMEDWVAHMVTVDPDLIYLKQTQLGTPDDDVTLTLDGSPFLADRERAIAAHRSQASPFDGLPESLRERFLTEDHLLLA